MQRLGDYIDQIRGVSYKPADVRDENSGIAILRANNIQDKVDLSDLVYVDENKVSDVQFLKKGDVLICASSGSKNLVGKAVLIPNDMNASFGAFCKVVRIKQISEVNSDFIRMFFLSKNYRNAIAECSIGANINNIKSDHLNGLGINIPNYDIQCSAVDYLTKLKQAIDLKRKQLEDLDELVKSKFQEMFGDVSMNSKGYTVSNMLDVSYGGGQYGAASASIEKDLDRPRYIRITDIDDFGELNDDYVVSINVSDDNDYLLEYGDFLFARSGATVGKTYYYNTNERQIFAGYLIRFKLNLELVNPCFLFYYTKTDYYSTWVLSQQGGAAQPNINAKKYGSLPVLLPPISLQSTFADYVNKTNAAKQIIKHEISDLEELMDSKMDKCFG